MANEFVTRKGLISLGGISYPYVAINGTYNVDAQTDHFIDCTTGTFTVTLPTAVGQPGKFYVIKNSGSGTITVATTSSQTIDGNLTETLDQYDSIQVVSDGTNWIIAGADGTNLCCILTLALEDKIAVLDSSINVNILDRLNA